MAPRTMVQQKTVVIHGRDFIEKKTKFHKEVTSLFNQRSSTANTEYHRINKVINGMVIAWNRDLMEDHYDLHYMTTEGAVQYVAELVDQLEKSQSIVFITGRGNHSRNKTPAIKKRLFEVYGSKRRFEIKEVENNPGAVIISVR